MAYSLNKTWTAMAASLIAAAGVVSAAPNYYDADYRDNCCDNYGHVGLKPAVDGCGSWFFSAEALYWKASEDGLAFGSAHDISNGANGTSLNLIEVQQPRFSWDWGFRLGAGYDFSCGWDLRAYWTHYHGNAHGHAQDRSEDTVSLFPTWGTNTGIGDDALTDIHASWKLRLDLADFELGREFGCGPCVSLRPHIGLRAAWLNQKYEIDNAKAATVGESSTPVTNHQFVDLKSEFDGLGLRAGLDTQWNVGCGFSLYGNAALSAVYGTFHNHTEEFDLVFTNSLTDPSQNFIEQKDHYHACRFITDLALGVRWSQAYCCDTVILTVQLGWEHHLFIDQNRFEDFADHTDLNSKNPSISRGDLSLHGWTFGAKIDF